MQDFSQHSIRSYGVRRGRITAGQRHALDHLWAVYGLASSQALDSEQIFSRAAPTYLEIGFGNGESLVQMAQTHPENNYVGIEVYPSGIGHILLCIAELGLATLRVYNADANFILESRIYDQSLSGINVFFPDPWPKKRHHKRRLVTPAFALLCAHKLKPGAALQLATDCEDYAHQMLSVLQNCPLLNNSSAEGSFVSRSQQERPTTKFETRALEARRAIRNLRFIRI